MCIMGGSKVDWVVARSTQPFILPRLVKWVPETSGNLVVKSKLPPPSSSSLETVEPHPWKRGYNVFLFFIMHCRKYHLHDCNRDYACIISKIIVTHIFAVETFTCINAPKISTNIIVEESTTDIIAIELENLHNCSRRWDVHNSYRKCQLYSSYRNCHLQHWLQKISLAEMVPVRSHFNCNKGI